MLSRQGVRASFCLRFAHSLLGGRVGHLLQYPPWSLGLCCFSFLPYSEVPGSVFSGLISESPALGSAPAWAASPWHEPRRSSPPGTPRSPQRPPQRADSSRQRRSCFLIWLRFPFARKRHPTCRSARAARFLSPWRGSPASSLSLLLLPTSCRATRLHCSQTPPPFGFPLRMTVPPPALLRTTSGSLCFLLSLLPRLGGGSPPRFLSSLCQKTPHKQAPKSGYSLFSRISSQILAPGWWICPRTGWFYLPNVPLAHQSPSTSPSTVLLGEKKPSCRTNIKGSPTDGR